MPIFALKRVLCVLLGGPRVRAVSLQAFRQSPEPAPGFERLVHTQ